MIINRIFLQYTSFLELVRHDNGLPKMDNLFITFFLPNSYFYDAFHLQIIERALMTRADYVEASEKALSLFEYGQV